MICYLIPKDGFQCRNQIWEDDIDPLEIDSKKIRRVQEDHRHGFAHFTILQNKDGTFLEELLTNILNSFNMV